MTPIQAAIVRPARGPIRVRIPYRVDNRARLKSLGIRSPEWHREGSYWTAPRGRFAEILAWLTREADVDVWVQGRLDQKCDTRCIGARGDDCSCACAGANHAGGAWPSGMILVGDTTLVGEEITQAHYRAPRRTT